MALFDNLYTRYGQGEKGYTEASRSGDTGLETFAEQLKADTELSKLEVQEVYEMVGKGGQRQRLELFLRISGTKEQKLLVYTLGGDNLAKYYDCATLSPTPDDPIPGRYIGFETSRDLIKEAAKKLATAPTQRNPRLASEPSCLYQTQEYTIIRKPGDKQWTHPTEDNS